MAGLVRCPQNTELQPWPVAQCALVTLEFYFDNIMAQCEFTICWWNYTRKAGIKLSLDLVPQVNTQHSTTSSVTY